MKSHYPEHFKDSSINEHLPRENLLYLGNSDQRQQINNSKKIKEEFKIKIKEFRKGQKKYRKIDKKITREGVRERTSKELHIVMTILSDLERMDLRIENKLQDIRNNKGEDRIDYGNIFNFLIFRRQKASIDKRNGTF